MLERKLYGCVIPTVTPLDKKQRVDTDSLENLTEYLIRKGMPCLYPNGTTGEMLLFSVEDRKRIAETVVRKAAGRARVYVQTGAMSLEDTIALSRHAAMIGADGIGVVTPSYFKMEDEALSRFYGNVARSVPEDFPIYLYGIPQCAVNDISVSAAARVAAECPNVIGIKYSFADMGKMLAMTEIRNGTFSVLTGPDDLSCAAAGTERFRETPRSYRSNMRLWERPLRRGTRSWQGGFRGGRRCLTESSWQKTTFPVTRLC